MYVYIYIYICINRVIYTCIYTYIYTRHDCPDLTHSNTRYLFVLRRGEGGNAENKNCT